MHKIRNHVHSHCEKKNNIYFRRVAYRVHFHVQSGATSLGHNPKCGSAGLSEEQLSPSSLRVRMS